MQFWRPDQILRTMNTTKLIPLSGRLVPLRTRDEVRASLETCTVYVVEVPAKHANVVKE